MQLIDILYDVLLDNIQQNCLQNFKVLADNLDFVLFMCFVYNDNIDWKLALFMACLWLW